MTNIVKKTIKKSFINRHAADAVRYALQMERDGAKLLGLNGGARQLQLSHEITIEEVDPVLEIEEEVIVDEPTTEAITTEEEVEDEKPEDVSEPEAPESLDIEWDYAETLDKEALLVYLKEVAPEFESKATTAKGILKAAKKALQ
jgi:hypothetical protein